MKRRPPPVTPSVIAARIAELEASAPDTLPSPLADVLEREKQAFLDATAIALFARGRGPRNAYADAELLWAERQRRILK